MKCEIVQDLLPLYCDGVCSDESRQAVDEHVAQCTDCQKYLAGMKEEVVSMSPHQTGNEEEVRVLRGVKRRFTLRRRLAVAATIVVMLVLSTILIAAADVERPVDYTEGLVTAKLAEDEVIDLFYHGGHYASFEGFSREVGGRNAVFLCYTQTLKSNVLPRGEGHISIGNTLLTDFETACYQVPRNIDAVYYLTGDYVRLPGMSEAEFEQTMVDAVLLWERET